jgi:hypothetical protein
MTLFIGDVQGCDDALARLLAEADASPSRDRLVLLGDLVNRGPGSLATPMRPLCASTASLQKASPSPDEYCFTSNCLNGSKTSS